jgi:hypothetical protein
MKAAGRAAAWAALALGTGAALLETLPLPWIAIGLAGAAGAALAALRARTTPGRLFALHAAAIALALALAEAWLAARGVERFEGYEPAEYFREDEILGYALRPDRQVRARRVVGGEVAYDVVYSIDRHGLRAEPPLAPGAGARCVLFFGGSFTYGEGVEDDETLPWRTGVRAGGRLRVLNFGLHGYGPHQMLAALEEGVVERALDGCTPRVAVYQGVWFHAFRSAGRETWDPRGPRYALDPQGAVVRRGRFDDDPALRARRALRERLLRSFLFRTLGEPRRRPTPAEEALYAAIVERAGRVIESRWPGSRFHVLYWDEPWVPLEEALEARGLRVHRVSRILPDWHEHRERYAVHPSDQHPNVLAFDRLAAYVVAEILPPALVGEHPAR